MLQQNLAPARNDKVGAQLAGFAFNGNGSPSAKTNGAQIITYIGKPKGGHVARGNGKGLVGALGWIQDQSGLHFSSLVFLRRRNVLLDPFLNPQAMQRLVGIAVGNKQNATVFLAFLNLLYKTINVILSRQSGQVSEKAQDGGFRLVHERNLAAVERDEVQRGRGGDWRSHLDLHCCRNNNKAEWD